MKSAVSSSNSAALTTAISIGVVLGIFTTFVITVSLVAILRRRRYLTDYQFRTAALISNNNNFVYWLYLTCLLPTVSLLVKVLLHNIPLMN